jgi:hypothetical protein
MAKQLLVGGEMVATSCAASRGPSTQAEQLARELAGQASTIDERNGLFRGLMKSALPAHARYRDGGPPRLSTSRVTATAPSSSRRREAVWPIVFFDGIVVHVRGELGQVRQSTIFGNAGREDRRVELARPAR